MSLVKWLLGERMGLDSPDGSFLATL